MKRILLILGLLLSLTLPSAAHRGVRFTSNSYTTTFAGTENPLSTSGRWVQGALSGLDWSNTRITTGLAFGTQTGTQTTYNDSISLLTGTWANDQTITAVVHTANQQGGGSCYEEVALWLRATVSSHVMQGYENGFRMAHDGSQYLGTTQFLGPIGQIGGPCASGCAFTSYDPGTIGPGISDGDTISASIVGTLITGKINGSTIWTHDTSGDSTKYSSGRPGFSHWYRNTGGSACGTGVPSDYGLTSYTVTAS